MKRKRIGLLLVLTILAIGCKSQAVQKEAVSVETSTSKEESEIGGEWELVDIQSRYMTDETLEELFPLKRPFLGINEKDMIIYGNNGCNVFRGPIKSLKNNTLILDKGLASTLKYCSGVKSTVFMQTLGEVKTYEIKKNELSLYSADKTVFLKFKKINI